MTDIQFKDFLLNENKIFLGQKVGDILDSLKDISDNEDGLGVRQIAKNAEQTVNYIRRILHTSWPKSEEKNLRKLQKVGVALMKAVEEKGDLPGTITSAIEEIQKVMASLGVPVNQLGSPEGSEPESAPENTGVAKPEKPETPEAPEQQAPPEEPPQMPLQGAGQ